MKITLLILSLVVGLLTVAECSSSWPPPRCCTAKQFEIGFGAVIGQVSDNVVIAIQEYFSGAFDFKGRQYGMDVYIHQYNAEPEYLHYQVIQLFQKGKIYVIMDGVCTTMPLTEEPNRCVSDSANYSNSYYLGNNALLLDSWIQHGDPATGIEGDVYATTSRDDCTPGSISFMGTMPGPEGKVQTSIQGSYMNFTEGIQNPDKWFVPPSSCGNATLMTEGSSWPPIQHWRRMQATHMFL